LKCFLFPIYAEPVQSWAVGSRQELDGRGIVIGSEDYLARAVALLEPGKIYK